MDKNTFISEFKAAPPEVVVTVWNSYAQHGGGLYVIYENNDKFFRKFFANKPADAVKAVCQGIYDYYDQYVWFNSHACLVSGTKLSDLPIDMDALYEYLETSGDNVLEYFDDCFPETLGRFELE